MYTGQGLLVGRRGRTTRLAQLLIMVLLALSWPAPSLLKAQGVNLLSNPGFEGGSSSWSLSGNASIVDNQAAGVNAAMVYAGRRALRLMDTDNGCGSVIFDPYAAATQLVSISSNATAITVSFWYSRPRPSKRGAATARPVATPRASSRRSIGRRREPYFALAFTRPT